VWRDKRGRTWHTHETMKIGLTSFRFGGVPLETTAHHANAAAHANAEHPRRIFRLIFERVRRVRRKKAPPRNDRFDLNEAIDQVIGLARSAIAENGVSVQTRLTNGSLPVYGDRVQLQRVVLNLILNAVEAMSAAEEGARELSLSTEHSETYRVLVAVRDSGPGIDPERRERVFEPFCTTKSSGVGMPWRSLSVPPLRGCLPAVHGHREPGGANALQVYDTVVGKE
jgi:signal transduction histidine kinase